MVGVNDNLVSLLADQVCQSRRKAVLCSLIPGDSGELWTFPHIDGGEGACGLTISNNLIRVRSESGTSTHCFHLALVPRNVIASEEILLLLIADR